MEIEQAIATHPKVLDVAVIGVPDEEWGEVPRAFVVLQGEQRASEAEILDFCREKLAKYKQPTSVVFMDELPRNPTGKVEKGVLREEGATSDRR
jgi:acyl-CoA synthetase (AMP-forming)/AMP-acid ligase II